jgi:transposase
MAAMLIGFTGDIRRFPNRDRYAAYNGTAAVEFSSGGRTVHRLSQRGNRQLNHALHMVAVCQLRQPDSDGGPTSTGVSLRARRRRKPCALSSAKSATPSTANSSPTLPPSGAESGPGRTIGNDSKPA